MVKRILVLDYNADGNHMDSDVSSVVVQSYNNCLEESGKHKCGTKPT